MSYNGTGIYTLPGAQLINGEVVSATENNQFRNDVATALNTAWTRDGQAPATNNIPMANHKFTGLLPGTENGDSVRYEQATSDVAITGGTIEGVTISDVTLTGDFAFDSITTTGSITAGTTINATGTVSSADAIESTGVGVRFPDGTLQTTAFTSAQWTAFPSSGTFSVPDGVQKVRVYAFGAGGSGDSALNGYGGGGGGCAYGDIPVTSGQIINVSISGGVSTVTIGGTTYLTANSGANGSAGGAGGTASKHPSVTNGGNYTGGNGGANNGGGGAAATPLGNGGNGGAWAGGGGGAGGNGASIGYLGQGGGGGGAGGSGYLQAGGGSGSAATSVMGGMGRAAYQAFTDPLLLGCNGNGASTMGGIYCINGGPGGGGGGGYAEFVYAGNGGIFGGGGGVATTTNMGYAGNGGAFGGGGGSICYGSSSVTTTGGNGGVAAGGGRGVSPGAGGAALVLIYL